MRLAIGDGARHQFCKTVLRQAAVGNPCNEWAASIVCARPAAESFGIFLARIDLAQRFEQCQFA
jgi:hypothetical protein